eukprot:TRINITY_DN8391_c0_g1_i2.p2 TRINITY_DN8391_c0_g1~~TRINITY_DN8391_c0_g1_i2.p2  ORF type:complete len:410 (+),score=92.44 TRINITY_DN8391_c0_g1_i2:103-1332(+)
MPFVGGQVGRYEIRALLVKNATNSICVYRAVHSGTAHEVAIKAIRKYSYQEEQEERFRAEVNIMRELHGQPHVIQIIDDMEDSTHYYIVMELMATDISDSLRSWRRTNPGAAVPEDRVRRWITGLLIALRAAHKAGIAHHDLKPDNVLLSASGDPVLCDFGLSRKYSSREELSRAQSVGTMWYAAPEVRDATYDPFMADMYSVGTSAFASIAIKFPFPFRGPGGRHLPDSVYLQYIQRGLLNPYPAHASDDFKSFVAALIVPDPRRRMTLEDAMRHPWITGQAPPLPVPPSSPALCADAGDLEEDPVPEIPQVGAPPPCAEARAAQAQAGKVLAPSEDDADHRDPLGENWANEAHAAEEGQEAARRGIGSSAFLAPGGTLIAPPNSPITPGSAAHVVQYPESPLIAGRG